LVEVLRLAERQHGDARSASGHFLDDDASMTYSFVEDGFIRASLEVPANASVKGAFPTVERPTALGRWLTFVLSTGNRPFVCKWRRLR
jgi:hypothetical protein